MTGPTAAVLADIHGNYLALEACLDYARARGAKHCLFLGDYITDHPGPQRVMALLRQADSLNLAVAVGTSRNGGIR